MSWISTAGVRLGWAAASRRDSGRGRSSRDGPFFLPSSIVALQVAAYASTLAALLAIIALAVRLGGDILLCVYGSRCGATGYPPPW